MKIIPNLFTPAVCTEINARFWNARTFEDQGYGRTNAMPDIKDLLPPKLATAPHFITAYRVKGNLPPHNDGHDGHTLSVAIAASGDGLESWPMFVDDERFVLGLGDALIYSARSSHWRGPMPPTFEHYVVAVFALLKGNAFAAEVLSA